MPQTARDRATQYVESVSNYNRRMDLNRDPTPGGTTFMVANGLLATDSDDDLEAARDLVDRSVTAQVETGELFFGDRDYYTGSCGFVTGLLEFYDRTGDERYLEAAEKQIEFVRDAPRVDNGGISHNKDALELWVDSMYIMVPPIAQLGSTLEAEGRHDEAAQLYDEAAQQLIAHSEWLQDAKTGLFRHSWSAEPNNYPEGSFWGRGNGWAAAGILEVLEQLPDDHQQRDELRDILHDQLETVVSLQDASGFWWNVLDDQGSFLETSVSLIFAYVLHRSVDLGICPEQYREHAERAVAGVTNQVNDEGVVTGATFVTLHDPDTQVASDDVFSISSYAQGWYLVTLSYCLEHDHI